MAVCFRQLKAGGLRIYKNSFAILKPKGLCSEKYSFCRNLSTTRRLLTERFYSEKHEWVSVSGKIGTVGITDYAQSALGDVVYAQLPDPDTEFKANDECGALESVKAASELYCPVTGKVVEKNSAVEDRPSLINESCYEKGWLFKIELFKPEEIKELMNEEAYEKYVKAQEE